MQIHKDNLLIALTIAIEVQNKREKDQGFTSDSCLVAGLRDLKQAIQNGEHIEFYPKKRQL